MSVDNPSIILITGIMASGKSTVAQLLSPRETVNEMVTRLQNEARIT